MVPVRNAMTQSSVIPILGVLLLILLAIGHVLLRARLLLSLRRMEPDTWRQLGAPNPFFGGIRQCIAVSKWVRRVESADAPALLRQKRLLRLWGKIYMAYFFSFVLVFALWLRMQQ